jgi:hypothetical protein
MAEYKQEFEQMKQVVANYDVSISLKADKANLFDFDKNIHDLALKQKKILQSNDVLE